MQDNAISDFIEKLKYFEEKFSQNDVDDKTLNDFESLLRSLNNDVTKPDLKSDLNVRYKKLTQNAVEPTYAKNGDAGLDLTVTSISETNHTVTYKFGISVEIPYGYVGLLFSRSSVRKYEIILTNCVGVIDSGYRGEIEATFRKTNGLNSNIYNVGDRAAQLLILPYPTINIIESDTLSSTERGKNGYGSTGS